MYIYVHRITFVYCLVFAFLLSAINVWWYHLSDMHAWSTCNVHGSFNSSYVKLCHYLHSDLPVFLIESLWHYGNYSLTHKDATYFQIYVRNISNMYMYLHLMLYHSLTCKNKFLLCRVIRIDIKSACSAIALFLVGKIIPYCSLWELICMRKSNILINANIQTAVNPKQICFITYA